MYPIFLLLVISPLVVLAQPTSHITVTGSVFCDVCHNNSFTKHSYFLPGVNVNLQCKFQATARKTAVQNISFSVNRTTNRYGIYKMDLPSVEGVDCRIDKSFCEARLIGCSVLSTCCNLTTLSTSSREITIKARSTNFCVYRISALTYRPSNRNTTMCGIDKNLQDSFNSSKFFLPYWPLPPLPPWPSLPPLPQLPPFPSFPPCPPFPSFPPMPPFPSFPPFQYPPLPSSPPFRYPPLPPLPQLPPLPPLTQLPPLTPLPPLPPLTQLPPLTPLPPLPPLPQFPSLPQPSTPIQRSPGLNPRTWIPGPGFPFLPPLPPGSNPTEQMPIFTQSPQQP